jgi:hypothetical protein
MKGTFGWLHVGTNTADHTVRVLTSGILYKRGVACFFTTAVLLNHLKPHPAGQLY